MYDVKAVFDLKRVAHPPRGIILSRGQPDRHHRARGERYETKNERQQRAHSMPSYQMVPLSFDP